MNTHQILQRSLRSGSTIVGQALSNFQKISREGVAEGEALSIRFLHAF